MVTACPRLCRPTAASTTRRSAPPMPRSGCRKTICFFFMVLDALYPLKASRRLELQGCSCQQLPEVPALTMQDLLQSHEIHEFPG